MSTAVTPRPPMDRWEAEDDGYWDTNNTTARQQHNGPKTPTSMRKHMKTPTMGDHGSQAMDQVGQLRSSTLKHSSY